jgi:signal transduction histidine kinase
VREPLEAAIRMASHALDDTATLARDYTPVPPVLASEAWLAQLFMNLLLNAAHAVADASKKTIQASIRPDDECVAIEIRDTGRGIPRTSLARIFDPFFTTKPTGEGLGLGLWISRSIVTALGGKLSVESEVGVGTTVRVSLPVAGGATP